MEFEFGVIIRELLDVFRWFLYLVEFDNVVKERFAECEQVLTDHEVLHALLQALLDALTVCLCHFAETLVYHVL